MSESLKNLVHEVHRRSLWQVLAIYLGASWLVFEVVQTLTEGLGLPDWVPPFAFVLLLVGFPIVMATAFVQEGIGSGGKAAARAAAEDAGATGEDAAVEAQPSASEGARAGASAEAPSARAVPEGASARAGARRLFTWRNALLGGVAAFALLGVVTAGYMGMRLLGIGPVGSLVAAGVLEERDRIILADFENNTADSLLSVVVTEAFRVDLSQSPIVTIVEPAYVDRVLARMGQEPDARLDLGLAREIAVREGIKAAIGGEIGRAGGNYVLTARLVSPETGEILAAARETASDSGAIVAAIDELSRDIRKRIGESLKRVRASQPLESVTTSSLDALRKYSQGVRAISEAEEARAIRLLEEAVALDSTFAMAWRKLGVALLNRGEQRARWIQALGRAFELRDRLTERERYLTEGTYYQNVTEEVEKAVTAYRTLLDIRPDDAWALNNLGLLYGQELHDFERAAAMYRRVIALDSLTSSGYQNLAAALVAQGEIDSAQAVIDRMAERHQQDPVVHYFQAQLEFVKGDYEAAERRVEEVRANYGADLFLRARTTEELSRLARLQGRLTESERLLRETMRIEEERDVAAGYLGSAVELAIQHLMLLGERERARLVLDRALERHPITSLAPLDRPYGPLAGVYALAGDTARARGYLEEIEALSELPEAAAEEPHLARGFLALAEDRHEDAIEEFRMAVADGGCPVCWLPPLAMAYNSAGKADSVLAVYERYVSTPWLFRGWQDSFFLGNAYERLALLYEERGDTAKARYYYGKLVDLWEGADPELQPRVEAARRAIRALSGDV